MNDLQKEKMKMVAEKELKEACLELVARGIKVKDLDDYSVYATYRGLEILKKTDFDVFKETYEKVHQKFHEDMERDLGGGVIDTKKVLVVNKSVAEMLSKSFNLTENETFNRVEYVSPNGFISRSISLFEFEFYQQPSGLSLPTSDLSQYEKIAEDILNYKEFMDSFELKDYHIAFQEFLDEL